MTVLQIYFSTRDWPPAHPASGPLSRREIAMQALGQEFWIEVVKTFGMIALGIIGLYNLKLTLTVRKQTNHMQTEMQRLAKAEGSVEGQATGLAKGRAEGVRLADAVTTERDRVDNK